VAIVPGVTIEIAAAFKQRKRHLYAGKRQAPLEPLIVVGRKLLLERKEAITVLAEVLSKQT
jgi:hypothetical protein